jgi:hypothetical protein
MKKVKKYLVTYDKYQSEFVPDSGTIQFKDFTGNEWDDAVTGIGNTPNAAFKNAIERLSARGFDVRNIRNINPKSTGETSMKEKWYYITIKVKA